MKSSPRENMEFFVQGWYERRVTKRKLANWDAQNHIIGLPEISILTLTYYYEHCDNDKIIPARSEDGQCAHGGALCIHRSEYYGCAGCDIKIEHDRKNPQKEDE